MRQEPKVALGSCGSRLQKMCRRGLGLLNIAVPVTTFRAPLTISTLDRGRCRALLLEPFRIQGIDAIVELAGQAGLMHPSRAVLLQIQGNQASEPLLPICLLPTQESIRPFCAQFNRMGLSLERVSFRFQVSLLPIFPRRSDLGCWIGVKIKGPC